MADDKKLDDVSRVMEGFPGLEALHTFVTDAGYKISIRNVAELIKFIQREQSFWEETEAKVQQIAKFSLPEIVHSGWKRGKNIAALWAERDFENAVPELRQLLTDAANLALITSQSNVAFALRNALERESVNDIASIVERIRLRPDPLNLPFPEVFPSHSELNILEKVHSKAAIILEEIGGIRERAAGEWTNFHNNSEMVRARLKGLEKDIPEAIENAKNAVAEDRALKEAREYWEGKFKLHMWTTLGALGVFVVGIGLLIFFGIPFFVSEMPARSEEVRVDEVEWFFTFIRLGVPGLLCVWLLRTALSVFREQARYAVDAKERSTMIQAYHSLHIHAGMTEDDRHLMLKSLFRPSMSPADDEPMPSWIDTLFTRAGLREGGGVNRG